MTPPADPPRPLRLADRPPQEAPRRTWTIAEIGDLAETTAGKVGALADSVDREDDGIKASLVAIRRAQEEQARATEALAKSTESAWGELGTVKDNTTAIGASLADLQAALILRDVEAERRAKSIALTAGKEASKGAESRGAKTATAALTAIGAIMWAAIQIIKLLQGA